MIAPMRFGLALLLLVSCSDSYEATVTNYLWDNYSTETRDLLLFLESTRAQDKLSEAQGVELESLFGSWAKSVRLVHPETKAVLEVENPLQIIDDDKHANPNSTSSRYESLIRDFRNFPDTLSFLSNNRSIVRVALISADLGVSGQAVSNGLIDTVEMIRNLEESYLDLFNYSPQILEAYSECDFSNPAGVHPHALLTILKTKRALRKLHEVDGDSIEFLANMESHGMDNLKTIYSMIAQSGYKSVNFEIVQKLSGREYEIEIMEERCILILNTIEYTSTGKATLPILFNGSIRAGKTTKGFRREYPEFFEVSPEEFSKRMSGPIRHYSLRARNTPKMMLNKLNVRIDTFEREFPVAAEVKEKTFEILWHYDGKDKNGEKDGLETLWHHNGQKQSEGEYENGKQEGIWTTWYLNGQKGEEGLYKGGEQEGIWTEWYKNGQKWYEGHYRGGGQEGIWTTWYLNGRKLTEGKYENGKEEGLWTSWHEDGSTNAEESGLYKDGKKISDLPKESPF